MDEPHISPVVLWFFRRIVRGYFRRHFTAVRLSRSSNLAHLEDKRLILYANHSSWWDPMVSVLLGQKLMPRRNHYAPMDATSLARYGILKRVGVFGVDLNSMRGAAKFIRGSLRVLADGGVLWVTPQGRFADARERPLEFKPGLAVLAARVPCGVSVQPLAMEYVFWNQRLPEVLLHLGDTVEATGQPAAELTRELEVALLETMERLKALALARNEEAFTIIKRGRVGTGGFYALSQRALALVRGRRFKAEHVAPSSVAHEGHR